uniref:Uncharacterized protein n=1 Tax=Sander lucioperca TaxID=283035 RepID=A0A8D0AFE1_SANLU
VKPGTIIDLSHVQQKVQASIQQLHCKEVHLVFALLSRAEIERDGSHPLGVPLWEADVGLGSLKRNGVQSGYIFTLVGYFTLDFHLRVHNASQPGQLKTDVIVLIHHL